QAVKIHNLHVVKDTPLEAMYRAGTVRMLERDEYVAVVCDFLERLLPEMVIQRLNGDAPPDYLVAPAWCLDKPALLTAIHAELERRDSWQGKNVGTQERAEPVPETRTDPGRVSLALVDPRP